MRLPLSMATCAIFFTTVAAPTHAAASPVPQHDPTTGQERMASFARRVEMERSSIFQNLEFSNIGPIEMNGRLVDVEFPEPENPFTFLIAYGSGGLWKTTNNGTSFEPLFDEQASIIMGDVAVDPTNPNHIWVGTGEKNASRSTYSGTGVYKSTDGGKTWQHMGLEDTHRIAKIIISEYDPNTVWVGAQGSLYTDSEHRGVYKTTDGGTTWRKVLYVDEMTGVADLAIHPTDRNVFYAATWTKDRKAWNFVEGGPGSGIWRSDDEGETWKRLGGGFPSGEHLGRIGLAVTPDAPDVIYASLDNQAPKPDEDQPEPSESPFAPVNLKDMTEEEFLALEDSEVRGFLNRFHPDDTIEKVREMVENGELTVRDMFNRLVENSPTALDKQIIGAQVWLSSDRGENWTLQNEDYLDGLYSTYGYYFGDIRVSPQDVNTLYLLGVPFIKSTDGGRNWKRASGSGVHSDHQALWINPWNHNHIVDGNDGGLDISYDGGQTWVNMAYPAVGQFYAICYDMAEPYRVYGGLQDNGVWMGPSNRTFENNIWTSIGGGDGMRVQVDTRTNEVVISGSQFGSYSAVDRADNQRWRLRPLSHVYEVSNRFNWQSPVVMSPHSPEIIYFGTQRLYRSLDQGRTFTTISEDLTTSREPGDVPFSTIVTISESPKKFGLIYVGTDDGLVHVTQDGGISWTKTTRRLPEDRYVSRVVASMHEESVAYVSLNGYRNDDFSTYLFRTEDHGRRWNSIKGNLPDEPVNVVREDPRHPEILYIGTDTGCYMSLDTGQSWHALAGKLPHVPVHDAAVHPRENDLILGTHGRSVFILDIAPIQELLDEVPVQTEEETEEEGQEPTGQEEVPKIRVIDKPLHVYAIADIEHQRSWPWENQRERAYWVEPPEPPVKDLLYYSRSAGPTTLTIADEDGNPLRVLEDEAELGINVVKWDHTLDPELAMRAREAREASQSERERGQPGRQQQEEEQEEEQKEFEEWMTWYIYPGTYSLEVVRGEFTEKVNFKVVESRQGGQGPPFLFNP